MQKVLRSFYLLIITSLFVFSVCGQTTNSAAKKTNKIRLGVIPVKTTSVAQGVNAQQFGEAIQNSLTEYLKAPNVEIIMLESKLASQIPNEAKEKNCDYVISVVAAHKKGGSGALGMLKTVAPALTMVVPMAGMAGGMAGAIAGQAAAGAISTAASVSGNTKAKDSLQLDLTMQKTGAAETALTKQYKSKAKSDGEDIISPLIEQIAQAIIDTASGKPVAEPAK